MPDLSEALALCRSEVALDQGRVAEAGCLADLLRAPQSELLRVFLEHLQRTGLSSGSGMISRDSKEARSDGRLTQPT